MFVTACIKLLCTNLVTYTVAMLHYFDRKTLYYQNMVASYVQVLKICIYVVLYTLASIYSTYIFNSEIISPI